jgi:hypothetical protein
MALEYLHSMNARPMADIPPALLSGWLSAKPNYFADLWEQISRGQYSDCTVQLGVAPLELVGLEWNWDIKKNKGLSIKTYSIVFNRRAVKEKLDPTAARRNWLSRS